MALKDKTVISISTKTKERLQGAKFGKGESYDSVIEHLLEFYDRKK